MDHIIPAKNLMALFGCYISVGGLIPCVGLFAGPVALTLGLLGLRHIARNSGMVGKAHCWVAIVLWTLELVGNVVLMFLLNRVTWG